MSIKIGSNELTSAGSATYDGTDLYKIIYNGTTVWTKGGTFMPDNDIALYGLTYSGGNITFKVLPVDALPLTITFLSLISSL